MTPINNFQTWQNLSTLVNVQQNGQIPPTVFNNWYNETNNWLFNYYGNMYQQNQTISDYLSPFIKPVNIIVAQQPGQNFGVAVYPTDYEFFLSASLLLQRNGQKCFIKEPYPIIDAKGNSKKYTDPDIAEMVQNYAGANMSERVLNLIDMQRWAACLEHLTKGPTFDSPKMVQFNGGFKVAPKGIYSILLYYLSTPIKSIFSYTINGSDIAVYDPSTSQQLQWSEQVTPIFLAHLQIKYGQYVNAPDIIKAGEEALKIALG